MEKITIAIDVQRKNRQPEVDVGLSLCGMWKTQSKWTNRGRQHNGHIHSLAYLFDPLFSWGSRKEEKEISSILFQPCLSLLALPHPPLPLANYHFLKFWRKEKRKEKKAKMFSFLNQIGWCHEGRDPTNETWYGSQLFLPKPILLGLVHGACHLELIRVSVDN